jgi:hypothetical protein
MSQLADDVMYYERLIPAALRACDDTHRTSRRVCFMCC